MFPITNQPCYHENLQAQIQMNEERGTVFLNDRFWCKECKKFIRLKYLQKPKKVVDNDCEQSDR